MIVELRDLAGIAVTQKERILGAEGGGFTPIPHTLMRDILPVLRDKPIGDKGALASKTDARDALFLLVYLHGYTNGKSANSEYMWAFPNVKTIAEETGIHRDRIKPLCTLLEREGLLITRMVPRGGNVKKMYLPLYYPHKPSDSC